MTTPPTLSEISARLAAIPEVCFDWEAGGPYPSASVIRCVDAGCGGPYAEPPVYDLVFMIDERTEGKPDPAAQAVAAFIASAPTDIAFLLSLVGELLAACKLAEPELVGYSHDAVIAVISRAEEPKP